MSIILKRDYDLSVILKIVDIEEKLDELFYNFLE